MGPGEAIEAQDDDEDGQSLEEPLFDEDGDDSPDSEEIAEWLEDLDGGESGGRQVEGKDGG